MQYIILYRGTYPSIRYGGRLLRSHFFAQRVWVWGREQCYRLASSLGTLVVQFTAYRIIGRTTGCFSAVAARAPRLASSLSIHLP